MIQLTAKVNSAVYLVDHSKQLLNNRISENVFMVLKYACYDCKQVVVWIVVLFLHLHENESIVSNAVISMNSEWRWQ